MQEEVLSVSQALNFADKSVRNLGKLTVEGELSEWKGQHRSGHCYFSIKEEKNCMDAIIWGGTYARIPFAAELKDGLRVQVRGSFQVYAQRGTLSFIVDSIEIAGEGNLRMQVALLAKKLTEEGLTSDARKKPIPRFCSRICVVTSPSADALRDVKRTLLRRNPLVEIELSPCLVQGEGSAESVRLALKLAIERRPDAILIVRGGGSYEDLMSFNDEALARAIAASPVPIVTGIGHEPDQTIADLVADRRASTPTAAAESIAPPRTELAQELAALELRMNSFFEGSLINEASIQEKFIVDLRRVVTSALANQRRQLDNLRTRPVLQSPRGLLEQRQTNLYHAEDRLYESMPRILDGLKQEISRSANNSSRAVSGVLTTYMQSFSKMDSTLKALSPLKVLERGYAIVKDENGAVLRSSESIAVGEKIHVLLNAGELDAEVNAVIHTADKQD